MLETDARVTADGRVVLIHDATVDRTTGGTGPVAAMTWAELSTLDAGHRFVDLEGRHSFRGEGVRVPLLEEVIAALPDVWINVESKCAEAAGPIVELVRRMGAQDRVLIAAEHERTRVEARGYPGPWGASGEQVTRAWLLHRLGLARWHRPDYDILQIPLRRHGLPVLSKGLLRAAHRWNVPVHIWTVDDEATMRRLLEMGVDGIQTDRPDLGARVFAEVVGRPPAPGHP